MLVFFLLFYFLMKDESSITEYSDEERVFSAQQFRTRVPKNILITTPWTTLK